MLLITVQFEMYLLRFDVDEKSFIKIRIMGRYTSENRRRRSDNDIRITYQKHDNNNILHKNLLTSKPKMLYTMHDSTS